MKCAEGIYCALVTPLNSDESIDTRGTQRLVKKVLAGGVHGILALGSTGEQMALTTGAKEAFLKQLRRDIPTEIPMMVGCGATSTKLAIENCLQAESCGADAVIVTAPCFYPFGEDQLVKYYEEIVQATHLPVYLYNISRFVGIKLTASLVARLAADPRIQGLKESDRDEQLVRDLVAVTNHRENFSVIQGSDRIFLKSFRWGCKAGVTVVGNVEPALAPQLYNAWKKGDEKEAEALQEKLLEYVAVITSEGKYPQELKVILEHMGICHDEMTSPYLPLLEKQKESIVAEWNALICRR